ncbi:MAG TPA: hypothetical protein VL022_04790 [Moheibacter sp.]|nr:hypothetical protein [Moheibacter sp.]
MKKLLLLLLIMPFFGLAQTSLKDDDIHAAAGNRYEWLLTNVDPVMGMPSVSSLLWRMDMGEDEDFGSKEAMKHDELTQNWRFEDRNVFGNEKPQEVYVYWRGKWIVKDKEYIITKVTLEGDTERIITFFVNFWTRAINFRDIKPGETATVRFLTDVAALTVGKNGKSKIVVQTSKDYYE